MPLQIRRGTTVQRQALSGALAPLPGELIYDTVEQKIYVGDGTTTGGNALTGLSTEDAQDAAAGLFTTGSHSGITFTYNDAAGRIDATVTIAATGPFDGDLTGSVFSDTSTLLVDGVMGRLVGPLATSGLVGDLDTASFTINSSTGNVNIAPTGRTNFGSDTSLVNGDVYITRNSYSSAFGDGFTFAQHHATADAVNFNFLRTRGTGGAITAVANGDDIADLNFIGHDGTNRVAIGGITARVSGAVSLGIVPGEISFDTRNAAGVLAEKAVLTSEGIWKVNTIQALSGTLTVTGNVVGNLDGDVTGSVFTDGSTRVIDGTDGRITTPSVTISNTGYLQLPVYANDTARNSGIPFPSAGMVIFNTTLTKFQGYTGAAWVDFN
jgi:hypothetical protein